MKHHVSARVSARVSAAGLARLCALSALWPAAAGAATLEVGPGDDLAGLVQSLSPGNELVLDDGVYPVSALLTVTTQGTADQPVVIRAKNPGGAVLQVEPAEDGRYPSALIKLDGASFVTVEGLVLQGDGTWTQAEDPRYNGLVVSNSADVTLRDLEVLEVNRTAIYLSGDNADVTIDRARIHDVNEGYGLYVGCGDASCWTTGVTLSRSWIHDIGGDRSNGVYLAHGTQGATLSDNVIYGTTGRGVYLGSTERGAANTATGNAIWSTVEQGILVQGDARLHNNLVFNIDGVGIYTSDAERGSWSDIVISSNTVADTTGWAAYLEDWQAADGALVLANNALCNPLGYGVDLVLAQEDTALPVAPGYVSSNVVCGLVEGLDAFEGEVIAGGGWGDFTDAPGWDFYPSADSVLVDAGDPAGEAYVPAVDFNGVTRPGDRPDVGAYERDGEGNPGWQVQEGFKEPGVEARAQPRTVGGCCKDKKQQDSGAAVLLLPLLGLGAALRRGRARG